MSCAYSGVRDDSLWRAERMYVRTIGLSHITDMTGCDMTHHQTHAVIQSGLKANLPSIHHLHALNCVCLPQCSLLPLPTPHFYPPPSLLFPVSLSFCLCTYLQAPFSHCALKDASRRERDSACPPLRCPTQTKVR